MKLVTGLYEAPITTQLSKALTEAKNLDAAREPVTEESAPHVLARLIHDASVRALRNVPAEERLAFQVALTNKVLALLGNEAPDSGVDEDESVAAPAELLMALRGLGDAGLGSGVLSRPNLSLRQSDLLVNGPRDLRIGREVQLELASADRVELLVSFVKWSGLRLLRNELRDFVARRPGGLRVLTTTYLGATEPQALEALLELGADVKVSYDARRTRLHAKAWLFHRESGFSTAVIGSSNLSAAAMLDGCEWNVRLSAVDNAAILTKFATTFAQYWADPEFEPYERARFLEATQRRNQNLDALARAVQLRPYPHQQTVLDALETERSHGHHQNLVVAATGTGKTVIAALDFARLAKRDASLRLLFVAHRREILTQSLATFRAAMRDGHFGELLVGDERPTLGRHVFASIQSLHAEQLKRLAPDAYDVVIVDEFHHAQADTYRALLEHLKPKILLGLTATPERADGKSILGYFDHRIAAELRLWDALDQGLVVPFQYFGIHDGTDLSKVDFVSGRYDVSTLEKLYTADHVRANAVLRAVHEHVSGAEQLKALGFCVSVKHAEFMADFFSSRGVPSLAVSAETPNAERNGALQALRDGTVKVVFSRDLFNEGIDVPSVNTVLFLRPTESATVFLQQLGRGLRHEDGKSCLTVLDFIGNAHRRFRFDARFRALVGGTRASVRHAIEAGFPHLPAGCELRLDQESRAVVLQNVRAAVGTSTRELQEELGKLGDVSLPAFLEACELQPEELYTSRRTLTSLKFGAGLIKRFDEDSEVHSALSRVLHVDDDERLERWRSWFARDAAPTVVDAHSLMLFALLGFARRPVRELPECFAKLWADSPLRKEVSELLEVLSDRQRRSTSACAGVPFRVHATYSRDEVAAGLQLVPKDKLLRTQGGVLKVESARVDVFFITLEKDPKHFTPTTLYDDYPISQTRFHWESQSVTRADSDTGRRYRGLVDQPWRQLLFVRQSRDTPSGVTAPYLFLGPAKYVSHEGEKPMRVVWELEQPMPGDFFNRVKVAAG